MFHVKHFQYINIPITADPEINVIGETLNR